MRVVSKSIWQIMSFEWIHNQVDDDGNNLRLLQGIIDHRYDDSAVRREHGWVHLPNNVRRRKITTKGWDIRVQWSDGTESWIPMDVVKDSNPIELAEYSVSRGIAQEPAFAWWVPRILKKRNLLIKKLKSKHYKTNLKFGLKVPQSVAEAYEIDRENGNEHWANAIKKELKNVLVAFHLLEEGEATPVGSKLIPYHIIFDIKFDLTRKARLVAGGHRNKDVPAYATYSSVVSRESVRLGLLVAAINGLDILAADISNAYLNAPCREKVHVHVGEELFGKANIGKIAIIVRALYGLKSAGASWRKHLSETIQAELGYSPTKADPDVYLKPSKKQDGSKYYSYLIVYVDDILSIDVNPKVMIDRIGEYFKVKDDSVTFPKMYLGANMRRWKVQDETGSDIKTYALGSESYVKEALRCVEERMKEYGLCYPKKRGKTPFSSSDYKPELDTSEIAQSRIGNFYQNMVGILRWLCELGRLDILLETSLLSQYMVEPRMGHVNQALHVFSYLKNHHRSWIVANPNKFEIDWTPIQGEESPEMRASIMAEIYPDSKDQLPPGMPDPRGESIQLTTFVDADFASNRITRRSQTGIIVFANMAPLNWASKRQNNVESSTFGAEFMALKMAIEMLEGIRYKLRMFGVPLDGPVRILCDNQSVIKNSTFPESVLKKKHCSVAYHLVREYIAAGKALVYYESSKTNLADLFTKLLNYDARMRLIPAMLN